MKHVRYLLFVAIISISVSGCKKYLDIKSDQKLTIPANLRDCEALLSNTDVMNGGSTFWGEAAADNFYLLASRWENLSLAERDQYIWKKDADNSPGHWQSSYTIILNANQVLATLSQIKPDPGEENKWNTLKGTALFFRAFAMLNAVWIWAQPYDPANAQSSYGIPVKLTPDLNEKAGRGNVQQTYDHIIEDFKQAAELLPAVQPDNVTRKASLLTKAAAYAALARTWLSMRSYDNALASANAALQQYDPLMDFNTLDSMAANPVDNFNKEMIFLSQSVFSVAMNFARTDSFLFQSYAPNDLRRAVFFRSNGDGSFSFKGGYNGLRSYILFTGLATDELYLIQAECLARAGKTAEAMDRLNTLLVKRWKKNTFVPYTAANAAEALGVILTERRKELVFRGLRWSDLRRLNKEPRFAITIRREINGQQYTLPPNDLRYVLLIPINVLIRTDMPQNPR